MRKCVSHAANWTLLALRILFLYHTIFSSAVPAAQLNCGAAAKLLQLPHQFVASEFCCAIINIFVYIYVCCVHMSVRVCVRKFYAAFKYNRTLGISFHITKWIVYSLGDEFVITYNIISVSTQKRLCNLMCAIRFNTQIPFDFFLTFSLIFLTFVWNIVNFFIFYLITCNPVKFRK